MKSLLFRIDKQLNNNEIGKIIGINGRNIKKLYLDLESFGNYVKIYVHSKGIDIYGRITCINLTRMKINQYIDYYTCNYKPKYNNIKYNNIYLKLKEIYIDIPINPVYVNKFIGQNYSNINRIIKFFKSKNIDLDLDIDIINYKIVIKTYSNNYYTDNEIKLLIKTTINYEFSLYKLIDLEHTEIINDYDLGTPI